MSRSAWCVLPACAALAAFAAACTVEAPACRVDPAFADDRRSNSICVVRNGDRVLATVNRMSGKLDLPGGRREGDETGQCTAHRELFEETGIDATVGRLLIDRNSTLLFDCRLPASVDVARAPSVPPWALIEVAGIQWIDPNEQQPADWRFPGELETLRLALDRADQ
ncbi:MAG TPA: NUDIX hydrolase [Gammaproteobacteria bacterium]|jgi:8-oxo-dGTP pyrophosphatase MutT (NUDIX family)